MDNLFADTTLVEGRVRVESKRTTTSKSIIQLFTWLVFVGDITRALIGYR